MVYGCPAIATSIDASTSLSFYQKSHMAYDIEIRFSEKNNAICLNKELISSLSGLESYSSLSAECLDISRRLVGKDEHHTTIVDSLAVFLLMWHLVDSEDTNFDKHSFSFSVEISSNLPIGVGLGSSAAYCSVVAAFFLVVYGLIPYSEISPDNLKLIQSKAHEGEKILHSSPSGLDTAISTFGGLVLFRKDQSLNTISINQLNLNPCVYKPLKMLIINTHIPRSTADVVDAVRRFNDVNPEMCRSVFAEIRSICDAAVEICSRPLTDKSFDILCRLLDRNQISLKNLGVSHEKLDEIVRRLHSLGISSKLTGAGRGGCVIALVKTDSFCQTFEKVNKILENLKVTVIECAFCVPGVNIEIKYK